MSPEDLVKSTDKTQKRMLCAALLASANMHDEDDNYERMRYPAPVSELLVLVNFACGVPQRAPFPSAPPLTPRPNPLCAPSVPPWHPPGAALVALRPFRAARGLPHVGVAGHTLLW